MSNFPVKSLQMFIALLSPPLLKRGSLFVPQSSYSLTAVFFLDLEGAPLYIYPKMQYTAKPLTQVCVCVHEQLKQPAIQGGGGMMRRRICQLLDMSRTFKCSTRASASLSRANIAHTHTRVQAEGLNKTRVSRVPFTYIYIYIYTHT